MPDQHELLFRGIRYERGGVLDQALACYEAAARNTDPRTRSEALRRSADVHRTRCEWGLAFERAREAAAVAREAGLDEVLAEATNAEAAVHQSRGDLDTADRLYASILAMTEDQRVRGIALQNLGGIAGMKGDLSGAARRFEESLECFQEADYKRGIAIALNNVGRAALDQRDHTRALDVLRQAVFQAREVDDLELAALAATNLGEALLLAGDCERAEDEVSAALGFFKISGNVWRQVECMRLLGDVRRACGELEISERLYRQGLQMADGIGSSSESALLRERLDALDGGPASGEAEDLIV